MAMDSSGNSRPSPTKEGRVTYHRRLFVGLVIYSAVLVGSFALFQYFREKEFKAKELNEQLQGVNGSILEALVENDSVEFNKIASRRLSDGLRISVIDGKGRVVYDNSLDTLPGTNHLDRSEIAEAVKTGSGFSLRRHSESTGQTYFYSAKKGGDYIVRTAIPYTVSLNQLLAADYGFLWFMVGITAVMCVIGYFATRRVGLLVKRLNQFAERAERGERIFDTEPFPHDELGEISNHIVRLYARLQQAISDRDREHRQAMHQEQEKIRIKRQLTNNINHELKTPVASMQVCLETLLSHKGMAEEKREEFLVRCLSANERLRRLLGDVSAITRLEDGGESIVKEKVNLAEIVAEVCDEYAVEASGKGMAIVNAVSYDGPLCGNSSLLASVFRNLIGNAIAYSGGTMVELSQRPDEDGRCLTVIVADDGIGVAPEHLSRLFERFYRIDKGRSRQEGGTGLGLAIVKNGIAWHGGDITVKNRRQGGLEFRFTLPTG